MRSFHPCVGQLLTSVAIVFMAPAWAQHGDMHYFTGTWDFKIWDTSDVSGPPAITGVWMLESGLDSALALVGRVVLDDGPNVLGGDFTRELIAFDAHTKVFTRTIVTNAGGYYFFTPTGWEGDRITWTDSQHSAADTIQLREEIECTGPDSFNAVFYRKEGEAWLVQTRDKLQRTEKH